MSAHLTSVVRVSSGTWRASCVCGWVSVVTETGPFTTIGAAAERASWNHWVSHPLDSAEVPGG